MYVIVLKLEVMDLVIFDIFKIIDLKKVLEMGFGVICRIDCNEFFCMLLY